MAFKTSYEEIVAYLGVDPDAIVSASIDSSLPQSRRSICINELIVYGWAHGYTCTPIIPTIVAENGYRHDIILTRNSILWEQKGVITFDIPGKTGHAVYWDGEIIHDPIGVTYGLDRLYAKYDIFTFWVVLEGTPHVQHRKSNNSL